MSTYVDGRGSEPQRLLYSYLKELYPTQTIHYEFLIDELNQRIDIYLPYLGIAIEFDGIQHSEYTPFFHKDYSDFNLGKLLDRKKSDFLIERGIKLVRIPHNKMVKSSQELKDLIDSLSYPADDFTILEEINNAHQLNLEKQRSYRKEQYKKYKEKRKLK